MEDNWEMDCDEAGRGWEKPISIEPFECCGNARLVLGKGRFKVEKQEEQEEAPFRLPRFRRTHTTFHSQGQAQ